VSPESSDLMVVTKMKKFYSKYRVANHELLFGYKIRQAGNDPQTLVKIIDTEDRAQLQWNDQGTFDDGLDMTVCFALDTHAIREIASLQLLVNAPNVIQIKDWCFDVTNNTRFAAIALEKEPTTLLRYWSSQLEQNRVRLFASKKHFYIMMQLVNGLFHLHKRGIWHLDLKPANVVIDQKTTKVKLIDFDVAGVAPFRYTQRRKEAFTKHHTPPELLISRLPYVNIAQFERNRVPLAQRSIKQLYDAENAHYDWRADIWSLGSIFFWMVGGEFFVEIDPLGAAAECLRVFGEQNTQKLLEFCHRTFDVDELKHELQTTGALDFEKGADEAPVISVTIEDTVLKLKHMCETKDSDFDSHSSTASFFELMYRMLNPNPWTRPSFAEILNSDFFTDYFLPEARQPVITKTTIAASMLLDSYPKLGLRKAALQYLKSPERRRRSKSQVVATRLGDLNLPRYAEKLASLSPRKVRRLLEAFTDKDGFGTFLQLLMLEHRRMPQKLVCPKATAPSKRVLKLYQKAVSRVFSVRAQGAKYVEDVRLCFTIFGELKPMSFMSCKTFFVTTALYRKYVRKIRSNTKIDSVNSFSIMAACLTLASALFDAKPIQPIGILTRSNEFGINPQDIVVYAMEIFAHFSHTVLRKTAFDLLIEDEFEPEDQKFWNPSDDHLFEPDVKSRFINRLISLEASYNSWMFDPPILVQQAKGHGPYQKQVDAFLKLTLDEQIKQVF